MNKITSTNKPGYHGTRELEPWQKEAHHYQVTLRYDGREMQLDYFMGKAHTKPPTTFDVVACIIDDAIGFEDSTPLSFEEWCDDIGYDTDSRKAERIYNACMKQTAKLQVLLGENFHKILLMEEEEIKAICE